MFQKTNNILFIFLSIILSVYAQDTPVKNYLQQAGEYAEIYNGEIEAVYSTLQYKNLPYYNSSDFTDGDIVFRKNTYPNQKIRLDLYKDQLIVISPGKQYAITVCSSDVEKVYMYSKTFVWLTPPKESQLKTGFYLQLLDGEKIRLFHKENYSLQQDIQDKVVVTYFDRKIKYYLLYNNQYYPVKNKGSFSKIFPQYKKQINKFVKDHKLNFGQTPDESLFSLSDYCEQLLKKNNE